jgi:hypothetical protein
MRLLERQSGKVSSSEWQIRLIYAPHWNHSKNFSNKKMFATVSCVNLFSFSLHPLLVCATGFLNAIFPLKRIRDISVGCVFVQYAICGNTKLTFAQKSQACGGLKKA